MNTRAPVLMILLTALLGLGIASCIFTSKRMVCGKSCIATVQIDQLKAALGLFYNDIGRYPTTEEGLLALVDNPGLPNWSGGYLSKKTLPNDPWHNEYLYLCPGKHGEYDLWSWGADGLVGGEGEDRDIGNWNL